MQTETQKNWNKFFENDKKSPKRHPPFIVFIMLIALIFAAKYTIDKNGEIDYNDEQQLNNINVLALTDSEEISKSSYISNKNGLIMYENINKLEKIICDLNPDMLNTIDDKIEQIKNLDLSAEYEEMKNSIILKLEYYKLYLETSDQNYYNKCADINYLDELQKAFDKANVKNERISNEKIRFWYHPVP